MLTKQHTDIRDMLATHNGEKKPMLSVNLRTFPADTEIYETHCQHLPGMDSPVIFQPNDDYIQIKILIPSNGSGQDVSMMFLRPKDWVWHLKQAEEGAGKRHACHCCDGTGIDWNRN